MKKLLTLLLSGFLLVTYSVEAQGTENPDTASSFAVNEELEQWHHSAIANSAAISYSGEGVTIAVIDSGVDGTHPDLQGRMVEGFNTLTLETIAPYENSDGHGHGTHVAGIIAANSNGVGVTGVATKSSIMPIKVLGFGGVMENPISIGIRYAVDNGADIINMSLGFEPGKELDVDKEICEAVKYAYNSGVVVIAASGNSATDGNPSHYPAGCHGVVAVGSVDSSLRPSWFSSYDNFISVVAPGSNIYSTLPLGKSTGYSSVGYGSMSGTSMAAPMVAGAAALLIEAGVKDNKEIINILENTATDILSPGNDPYTGSGILNISRALNVVSPLTDENISKDTTINSSCLSVPEITSLNYLYDNTALVGIAPGWDSSSYPHYLEVLDFNANTSFTIALEERQIRYKLENIPDSLVLVRPFVNIDNNIKYGAWVQIRNKAWVNKVDAIDIAYPVTINSDAKQMRSNKIEVKAEWSGGVGLRVFYFKKTNQKTELSIKVGKKNHVLKIENSAKIGSFIIPKTKKKKIDKIRIRVLSSGNN